jgi:hypothetical protein
VSSTASGASELGDSYDSAWVYRVDPPPNGRSPSPPPPQPPSSSDRYHLLRQLLPLLQPISAPSFPTITKPTSPSPCCSHSPICLNKQSSRSLSSIYETHFQTHFRVIQTHFRAFLVRRSRTLKRGKEGEEGFFFFLGCSKTTTFCLGFLYFIFYYNMGISVILTLKS